MRKGKRLLIGILAIIVFGCSKTNDEAEITQNQICSNGFCERVPYGSGVNQWFNLYQTNTLQLSPVYVWAHPNGQSLANPGSAYNFSDTVKSTLIQSGISFISWESTPQVQTEADLAQTETDFITLINWLKINGAKYNLDVSKIVSGGRSRGTWASWPGTNIASLGIKGFFGVQAFPENGWLIRSPQNVVTASSIPVFLTYDESPGTTNNHKPEYGMIVQDAYKAAGIGNKASLYHSLQENKLHDSLVPFIKRVTN
jgi:hypothetical protein